MKKTLAAVAVLGAFAGSALAADVTLYGKVDLGPQYQNTNIDSLTYDATEDAIGVANEKKDSWGLKSGSNSGSRWGIKGSEKISEGLTVGFQLESGFTADDGKSGQGSRLFGRESRLYVQTDFGELGMGRMGGLDSGLGSYDVVSKGWAFGTGWGDSIGSNMAIFVGSSDRYDNMITYKSPTFAGVTVLAQASLSTTESGIDTAEGSSDTRRYYALGATGAWDALTAGLVFSTTDYERSWVNDKTAEELGEGREDMSKVVTGYVAYDFGVIKPMLSAQYFDDLNVDVWAHRSGDGWEKDAGKAVASWLQGYSVKGYGVALGATAPLASGTVYATVGYIDYETTEKMDVDSEKFSVDAIQFGVGYQYPLSKRTYVYTAAGYTKVSGECEDLDVEAKTTEVVAGIVHNF